MEDEEVEEEEEAEAEAAKRIIIKRGEDRKF